MKQKESNGTKHNKDRSKQIKTKQIKIKRNRTNQVKDRFSLSKLLLKRNTPVNFFNFDIPRGIFPENLFSYK